MVILPWGCWVAANFLPALSVDKASNKRGAYSQAGQGGQGSVSLGAGLGRRALRGERRFAGMHLKKATVALLKTLLCSSPLLSYAAPLGAI